MTAAEADPKEHGASLIQRCHGHLRTATELFLEHFHHAQ